MKRLHVLIVASVCFTVSAPARAVCLELADADDGDLFGRRTNTALGSNEFEFQATLDREFGFFGGNVDGWADAGYYDPLNIDLEYARLVNSWFLMADGLLNVRSTNVFERSAQLDPEDPYYTFALVNPPEFQFHSVLDYAVLSEYWNAFHDARSYQFRVCADGNYIMYDQPPAPAVLTAAEHDASFIRLFCSTPPAACSDPTAFDQGAFAGQGPSTRAAMIEHEMWHAWRDSRNISGAGPCGPRALVLWTDAGGDPADCHCEEAGHMCARDYGGPLFGPCPDPDFTCDAYYFHDPSGYAFYPETGEPEMARYTLADQRVRPPHLHTPFQVEFEFACDVVTHPNPDFVTTSMMDAAAADADYVAKYGLLPSPPFTCHAADLGMFSSYSAAPTGGCTLPCATLADCAALDCGQTQPFCNLAGCCECGLF